MIESPEDMISRVRQMASGSDTWDLSPNDIAALKYLLELVDSIPKPPPVDDDKSAWIAAHGCARLKTLLAENIEHSAVYRDERNAWIRGQLPEGWCLQSDYVGDELKEPRNSTEEDLELLEQARNDWKSDCQPFGERPVLKYTCVPNESRAGKRQLWCGAVAVSHVHGEPVLFGVPKEFVRSDK